MEDYKPHRMGSHSDTWGGAGDDDPCDCNRPKATPTHQSWENNLWDLVYNQCFNEIPVSQRVHELKKFIRTIEKETREEERTRLIKEIEGRKTPEEGDYIEKQQYHFWNLALDDLIHLLKP